jgi:hypothetical protein
MVNEPQMRILCERLDLANSTPRCAARRKSDGRPCQGAAMGNGRCRVHGGLSTGPRTPEGLERSRRANWKHGYYAAEAKAARRGGREAGRTLRRLLSLPGVKTDRYGELWHDGRDNVPTPPLLVTCGIFRQQALRLSPSEKVG